MNYLRRKRLPIGVQYKCNGLHAALAGLLLERHAHALKTLARLLNVRYGDGDVAKAATGVAVARAIALKVGVGLRPVVVGQLEDT